MRTVWNYTYTATWSFLRSRTAISFGGDFCGWVFGLVWVFCCCFDYFLTKSCVPLHIPTWSFPTDQFLQYWQILSSILNNVHWRQYINVNKRQYNFYKVHWYFSSNNCSCDPVTSCRVWTTRCYLTVLPIFLLLHLCVSLLYPGARRSCSKMCTRT